MEDAEGKVFVGSTGIVLRRLVNQLIDDQTPYRFTNAVRCYPGETDPVYGIRPCRKFLQEEIERTRPGRIIALGRIATEALTGERLPITQVVGGYFDRSNITDVRTQFSLHPSAMLHNPSLKPYFVKTFADIIKRPPPDAWAALHDTVTVNICQQVMAIKIIARAKGQRVVALDTEYNSRTNNLLCLSLCWEPNKAFVFSDRVLKNPVVRKALEDLISTTKMAAHNWKFDVWVLINALGLAPEVVLNPDNWWADSLTLRNLYHPEQQANLDVSGWMVGMGGHKQELFELLGTANKDVKTIGDRYERAYYDYPDVVMRYCGWDAIACRRLINYYESALKREGLWPLWADTFGPLGAPLLQMEYNGLRVDQEAMGALDERFKANMERELIAIRSTKVVKRLCTNWDRDIPVDEFNPRSAPQMRDLMFSEHGLNLKAREHTPTGLARVDKHTVKAATKQHSVLQHLAEFNRIRHKHSTYVVGYSKMLGLDGGLHTDYNQGGARTGRLTSRRPNIQNIPNRSWEEDKAIRRAFIPYEDDEWLLEVDFSQIEMRTGADISNDSVMVDCFLNDIDIHRKTAATALKISIDEVNKEQRQAAKPIEVTTIV